MAIRIHEKFIGGDNGMISGHFKKSVGATPCRMNLIENGKIRVGAVSSNTFEIVSIKKCSQI